jgi:hypothetical protein
MTTRPRAGSGPTAVSIGVAVKAKLFRIPSHTLSLLGNAQSMEIKIVLRSRTKGTLGILRLAVNIRKSLLGLRRISCLWGVGIPLFRRPGAIQMVGIRMQLPTEEKDWNLVYMKYTLWWYPWYIYQFVALDTHFWYILVSCLWSSNRGQIWTKSISIYSISIFILLRPRNVKKSRDELWMCWVFLWYC